MPYSSEHKSQSRNRILASAVDLFCRYGFDQVSIGEVMKHAKMTHGAFYTHFKSKSLLYAQAIQHAAKHSLWNKEKPSVLTLTALKQLISAYLSLPHVTQKQASCPLAFLATDVAHRDEVVRNSYAKVFQNLAQSIAVELKNWGVKNAESLSQQILTSMIGTVSIARSLGDETSQQLLLDNAKNNLFSLLSGLSNKPVDG
ncbi:TetR/AcrR family transcriptional regulator [Marinomonas agarivorans]|nr:TetR/AcrR family transcriptional regulator [Marinomonas agarivorans]